LKRHPFNFLEIKR